MRITFPSSFNLARGMTATQPFSFHFWIFWPFQRYYHRGARLHPNPLLLLFERFSFSLFRAFVEESSEDEVYGACACGSLYCLGSVYRRFVRALHFIVWANASSRTAERYSMLVVIWYRSDYSSQTSIFVRAISNNFHPNVCSTALHLSYHHIYSHEQNLCSYYDTMTP